jgi:hypothetical protein
MAFSEELAERIRQGLARRKGVEEKKMFGGIGRPSIRRPQPGRALAPD